MGVAFRTQSADDDLRGIAFDIGVGSGRPRAADRIVDELVDCCDHLAELAPSAQLGTATPNLAQEYGYYLTAGG
jgi:hypothetical protein